MGGLKEHGIDWTNMENNINIQKKYDTLMNLYRKGIKTFVPFSLQKLNAR